MPFSPSDKIDLLVRARRSCCICHRFRGVNLEIHHMQPAAKGGSDLRVNGIPLCFDCHADVEHYNSDHPRGTKYSPEELRRHRDDWSERVSTAGVEIANPKHLEIDCRIAQEIHWHMVCHDSFNFLRWHSLFEAFDGKYTRVLYELCSKFTLPDFQFVDADLESLRALFAADLAKAVWEISGLTYPHETMEGWYTIGSLLAIEGTDRYAEIVDQVNQADALLAAVSQSYLDLYSLIRKKLGLDLRFGASAEGGPPSNFRQLGQTS